MKYFQNHKEILLLHRIKECPGAEIGRQAWLRAMCPTDVRVRVPLRAQFHMII